MKCIDFQTVRKLRSLPNVHSEKFWWVMRVKNVIRSQRQTKNKNNRMQWNVATNGNLLFLERVRWRWLNLIARNKIRRENWKKKKNEANLIDYYYWMHDRCHYSSMNKSQRYSVEMFALVIWTWNNLSCNAKNKWENKCINFVKPFGWMNYLPHRSAEHDHK